MVVTHKGRIVGGHILAPGAGEMVNELALAISQRKKLTALAGFLHVYPTLSTTLGQLGADAAFRNAARLRWLVRK